jgi:uncharacterized membrane protein YjjP (DUF1212 family)
MNSLIMNNFSKLNFISIFISLFINIILYFYFSKFKNYDYFIKIFKITMIIIGILFGSFGYLCKNNHEKL